MISITRLGHDIHPWRWFYVRCIEHIPRTHHVLVLQSRCCFHKLSAGRTRFFVNRRWKFTRYEFALVTLFTLNWILIFAIPDYVPLPHNSITVDKYWWIYPICIDLGNYGILDQSLAIRWIYDNIEFFNGDRQSITLFGPGAGAASAGLLMVAPQTRDIVTKVIATSGSALADWALIKGNTLLLLLWLFSVNFIFIPFNSI